MTTIIDSTTERNPDGIPESLLDKHFVVADIYQSDTRPSVHISTTSIREALQECNPGVYLTPKTLALAFADRSSDANDPDWKGRIFTDRETAIRTLDEWSKSDDVVLEAAALLLQKHVDKLPNAGEMTDDGKVDVRFVTEQEKLTWQIAPVQKRIPPTTCTFDLIDSGIDPAVSQLCATGQVTTGPTLALSIFKAERTHRIMKDRTEEVYFVHEANSGVTIDLGSGGGLLADWMNGKLKDPPGLARWDYLTNTLEKIFRCVMVAKYCPDDNAKRRIRPKKAELVEIG